jgi:hypothetical protein
MDAPRETTLLHWWAFGGDGERSMLPLAAPHMVGDYFSFLFLGIRYWYPSETMCSAGSETYWMGSWLM